VTHDPEEAALLADEILVIDGGRLLQAGPRAEVFSRPASPQVARLLGIQNLATGVVTGPGEITAGTLRIAAATGDLAEGTDISGPSVPTASRRRSGRLRRRRPRCRRYGYLRQHHRPARRRP